MKCERSGRLRLVKCCRRCVLLRLPPRSPNRTAAGGARTSHIAPTSRWRVASGRMEGTGSVGHGEGACHRPPAARRRACVLTLTLTVSLWQLSQHMPYNLKFSTTLTAQQRVAGIQRVRALLPDCEQLRSTRALACARPPFGEAFDAPAAISTGFPQRGDRTSCEHARMDAGVSPRRPGGRTTPEKRCFPAMPALPPAALPARKARVRMRWGDCPRPRAQRGPAAWG